jgi:outer membrane lipoprotein-sorting protein
MKAEKADAETTANQKLEMNDFPSPLQNYKENGYKLELLGKEEVDGTEVYKLKLTREPVTIDGKKVDDISFYFFDVESLVPLVTESEIKSGPAKGKISQVKLSDYQEVDGLYFPFSISQGLKNGPGATMIIAKVETNPVIADSEFQMPVEVVAKDTEAQKDK